MFEEDLRQLADWIAKLIEAADGDLAEKLEGGPPCHLRAVMNDPAEARQHLKVVEALYQQEVLVSLSCWPLTTI